MCELSPSYVTLYKKEISYLIIMPIFKYYNHFECVTASLPVFSKIEKYVLQYWKVGVFQIFFKSLLSCSVKFMIADDLARLGQFISSYIIETDQHTGVDLKGHYNNNRG